MKKVLLPLLLLFAISFLIAVESAPSAIVGYVKYDCKAGINMIALPMVNDQVSTDLIGIANPTLTSISYWDPINQIWASSDAYDDGEGGIIWDPINPVTEGEALMVNATADFNYYSLGSLSAVNPTYPLEIGVNMIMVPLDRSDLSATDLFGIAVPELTSIAIWDNVNQIWSSSDAYDDGEGGIIWDPIQNTPIGTPLMVNSTVQFTWPASAKTAKTSK